MENNPIPDSAPKPVQVMDIQPTAPTTVTPTTAPQATPAPSGAEQPVSTTTDVAAPPTDVATSSDEPTSEAPADQQPAPLAAEAPKTAHKKPVIPVLIAVVIGLALIGVASFAYMQQDKPKDNLANTSQTPAKEETTPADIDSVNKSVDDDLSTTNDAADFDDATLSDTNLAL